MHEHGAPQNIFNNLKKEQSNEGDEEHPLRRSSRIRDKTTSTTTTAMIPMRRIRMLCLPLYNMGWVQDIIWSRRIFVLLGRIVILIIFSLKNHWLSKSTSQSWTESHISFRWLFSLKVCQHPDYPIKTVNDQHELRLIDKLIINNLLLFYFIFYLCFTFICTKRRWIMLCLPLNSMEGLQNTIWTERIFLLCYRIFILIFFSLKFPSVFVFSSSHSLYSNHSNSNSNSNSLYKYCHLIHSWSWWYNLSKHRIIHFVVNLYHLMIFFQVTIGYSFILKLLSSDSGNIWFCCNKI